MALISPAASTSSSVVAPTTVVRTVRFSNTNVVSHQPTSSTRNCRPLADQIDSSIQNWRRDIGGALVGVDVKQELIGSILIQSVFQPTNPQSDVNWEKFNRELLPTVDKFNAAWANLEPTIKSLRLTEFLRAHFNDRTYELIIWIVALKLNFSSFHIQQILTIYGFEGALSSNLDVLTPLAIQNNNKDFLEAIVQKKHPVEPTMKRMIRSGWSVNEATDFSQQWMNRPFALKNFDSRGSYILSVHSEASAINTLTQTN